MSKKGTEGGRYNVRVRLQRRIERAKLPRFFYRFINLLEWVLATSMSSTLDTSNIDLTRNIMVATGVLSPFIRRSR